mmetsp:Transcript_26220/g.48899  ORF Transcript_26220/g.48899 Transcript_26220/m.48899 type:complete len:294 (+) Transcript_26220:462-1343(+)
MVRLVGEEIHQDIRPHGVLVHPPIVDGDLRGLEVRPVSVEVGSRGVDGRDKIKVGLRGSFFQVSDESVKSLRMEEVRQSKEADHRVLARDDSKASQRAGVKHLQAHEQVHALVLRFLKQSVDPAVVTPQGAKGAKVAHAGGHHAGNASDRLEDDEPPFARLGRGVRAVEAGDEVESTVEHSLHEEVHCLVRKSLGRVRWEVVHAFFNLRLTPHMVLHGVLPCLLHFQRMLLLAHPEVLFEVSVVPDFSRHLAFLRISFGLRRDGRHSHGGRTKESRRSKGPREAAEGARSQGR